MGEIVTDALGTWEKVGQTISPYDQWQRFGEIHVVSSGQYRLMFTSERIDQVRSFAWLRTVYSGSLVSPARRIYPKPEPMRLAFPIPGEYLSVGIKTQQFEMLKKFRRYQSRDQVWGLAIEQLIVKTQESENTTTVLLSNPSYTRDPLRSDLWVSSFTEEVRDKRGILLLNFEVGRFYRATDNAVESDPVILESSNGRLTVAFTSPELIQAESIYVRVIY